MNYKKKVPEKFKDPSNLSEEEAKEQVEDLREAIEYHNYRYYVQNQPVISDAAYDRLFQRLEDLEETFPKYRSDLSPTRRVGAKPVDELQKIDHTATMLSLNAVLAEEEIEEFHDYILRQTGRKNVDFTAEPKFDGLSVEIKYRNGRFAHGATRGDGRTGEDISLNLKTLGGVPLRLQKSGKGDIPELLAVRGEVFLPLDAFQAVNKKRTEEGKEAFANPRNAAAGTVRQLDSRKVAELPLDIYFYDILKIEGRDFHSHREVLEQLPRWGLKTCSHNRSCRSLDEIREYRRDMTQIRDELQYEIDGIVLKVDNLALRSQLGTRQRSPRWAVAWKFPPKKEVTELQEIVVQVGRTGMLTPVALLQPVDVGGVTVSRATLHNEDEVHRKDVRSKDRVRIARAGDVIPEVVERIPVPGRKRSDEFSMPGKCPVCGSEVFREGAYHFCSGQLTCRAQLVGHLLHYTSRDAMDIEGLGEKVAQLLVDREMIKDIADLYRLSIKELEELPGFASRSARNLHRAIEGAKRVGLPRFLYSLGIRHVGRHVSRVLSRRLQGLKSLMKVSEKELREIDEIGPEIARSVHSFFQQKKNRRVLRKLAKAGVKVESLASESKGSELSGTRFVFTGTLEDYSREEAQSAVERRGGRAPSRVSGETDYLVVGKDPGSKLEDAREEGVTILEEKEFKKLLKKGEK